MSKLGRNICKNRYSSGTTKVDEVKDIWHASLAATYEIIEDLKIVENIGAEKNPNRHGVSTAEIRLDVQLSTYRFFTLFYLHSLRLCSDFSITTMEVSI
jgi:hypothetical protein